MFNLEERKQEESLKIVNKVNEMFKPWNIECLSEKDFNEAKRKVKNYILKNYRLYIDDKYSSLDSYIDYEMKNYEIEFCIEIDTPKKPDLEYIEYYVEFEIKLKQYKLLESHDSVSVINIYSFETPKDPY